ncbi:MAG TPA: GNAT family N-acetyltransferase [Pyrinomonadaceae bacterium]|nr:GNAT family N-acetyltransferase [Pyrinomonadaceae bacterium]
MTVTATTTSLGPARAEPLAEAQCEEALAFLGERPLHTVVMAGLMRQYGARVPWPRGRFYGCRDARGRLEGVALVGRATMLEARGAAALAAFARQARRCPSVRMIMAEAGDLESFWRHYAPGGREARVVRRELFYEFSRPSGGEDEAGGLRRATPRDLEQIVEAHARLFFEESGVDPLAEDAEGFRRRCALRVEAGRVWALFAGGELVFKADAVTETPEATYIEGVWVNPAHRLKGYGRRCWAALSRALLERAPAFCGLVNAENAAARHFYRSVGGVLFGDYDKVYL